MLISPCTCGVAYFTTYLRPFWMYRPRAVVLLTSIPIILAGQNIGTGEVSGGLYIALAAFGQLLPHVGQYLLMIIVFFSRSIVKRVIVSESLLTLRRCLISGKQPISLG